MDIEKTIKIAHASGYLAGPWSAADRSFPNPLGGWENAFKECAPGGP